MAFISTVDERYAGGIVSYSAGALDASNLLSTDAVIAESSNLSSTAYGTSIDDYSTADIDVYSLGILNTGFYTIDVDDWTWDWGNYDSGSIASFEVLDSNGFSIGIQYSSYSDINFTVLSSETYYVKVTGPSYGEAQYSIEYTKTGELVNYPATYALYVDGNTVVGETLSIAGTYFDSNGVPSADNLTSLVYWYRIKDGVDTRITGETGSDYIVTSDDIGYYIGYLYGFIDSHGFSEATTNVISTAGLIQSNVNSTPTVSSEIADASANEYIPYSYDTSINFSDADVGDTLTYSALIDNGDGTTSDLPNWLSIDSTGVISGTPANDAVGSLDIKVTAKDQDDETVSDIYTLTVNDTTYKPVVIIMDDFSYRSLEFSDTTLYNYDVSQNDVWQVSTTGESVEVKHGDWVLYAFSNQLDSDVEIILIDIDAELNTLIAEQAISANDNIENIIVDWLSTNNTDTIVYVPSILSKSSSGGAVPDSALQTLIDNNAIIVQSVANVSEEEGTRTTWGDSYSDVINVGAYNVDLNGDSLHGNPADFSVIDIFANGYIIHTDWGENFGTSFATPRVSAEITNEFIKAFDELNTIGMSKDDIEALGDFDYSDFVASILDLIATDIYVEIDDIYYSYSLISVLSDDVETSPIPTTYPEDLGEASKLHITDAVYSLPPTNIIENYSIAANFYNEGEGAYDVVKTVIYSDDTLAIKLSQNYVRTYDTGEVKTVDTTYNTDGTTATEHKTYHRADGTLHRSDEVLDGTTWFKTITLYELDGTTLKGTRENTLNDASDILKTVVIKDENGNVTSEITVYESTGVDKDGSSKTIYTAIVNDTGEAWVHEAGVNYLSKSYNTHNHQRYFENETDSIGKIFITEKEDANGNDISITYSNHFGYSETIAESPTQTDSWVDDAGVQHTEMEITTDIGFSLNETTTLGFDLVYTINTTTNTATITGTFVTSDGTTFNNVSASSAFDVTLYGGFADLSGTAITATGGSATLVGNSTNDGYIFTYADSNNVVHKLTVTDDAVMVSNELTLTGTTSDDILQDTTGIDNISTLEGADVVYALAGNDTITLTADAVWGAGYSARNVSNDSSVGTGEKITLDGLNRFSDVIDGGADIDSIVLTSGNDAFFIDDVYSAHHSSLTLSSTTQGVNSTARMVELETINAGEGNDIVDLTSSNYILANAIEINGEAGNDNLWGSNGNDVIDGGTGDDSIFGGTGSDTLTGGTGADAFQFTATAGSDIITDFDVSGDTIQLYYQAEDNHTNADLSLANGILTWDVDSTSNDVVIDLSATINSSDLNDLDALITFVEIV